MIEPLNVRIFKFTVKVRPYIKPVLFAFAVGLGIGYIAGMYGILNIGGKEIKSTGVKSVQAQSVTSTESVSQSNEVANKSCDFKVDVAGAVAVPGVYCMSNGSTVDEAVKVAGDLNKDIFAFKYVSQKMNFAKKVTSEQKIYIPFQDDVECTLKSDKPDYQKIVDSSNASDDIESSSTNSNTEQSTDTKNPLDTSISKSCISLNNASIEDLDTLDGVGIATAQKIVEGRPYKTIESLMDIKGIGQATFDKLKSKICL